MTYDMKLIDQQVQVDSIELAGALLRAWVRGDRPAFEAELDRSGQTPPDLPDTGEMERLQMLGAIAARIKDCADPLAPGRRDLGIDVCINLLSHLASPTLPQPANRAARSESRSASRSGMPGSVRW
jgi:hypothetical protein